MKFRLPLQDLRSFFTMAKINITSRLRLRVPSYCTHVLMNPEYGHTNIILTAVDVSTENCRIKCIWRAICAREESSAYKNKLRQKYLNNLNKAVRKLNLTEHLHAKRCFCLEAGFRFLFQYRWELQYRLSTLSTEENCCHILLLFDRLPCGPLP